MLGGGLGEPDPPRQPYRTSRPIESQPFIQQGGEGIALLGQHSLRAKPVTEQFAAWRWVFPWEPQHSFSPQQEVPERQHLAFSGWSQQYFASAQQRVCEAQHEGL